MSPGGIALGLGPAPPRAYTIWRLQPNHAGRRGRVQPVSRDGIEPRARPAQPPAYTSTQHAPGSSELHDPVHTTLPGRLPPRAHLSQQPARTIVLPARNPAARPLPFRA